MKASELKAQLDLVDAGSGTEAQKKSAKKVVYAIAAVQAFIALGFLVWIIQAVVRTIASS